MDHEVVPCSSKTCHWLSNSVWDHFGLRREKKCKSDHATWGPQKAYLNAYIIHCHGPVSFVVGEAKEVLLLQMSRGPWQINVVLILQAYFILKF